MAKKFIELIMNENQGGGGECSERHIVEVAELPTENIDTEVLYKCGDRYHEYVDGGAFSDFIIVQEGEAMSFVEIATEMGYTYSFNTIPTRTTENIQLSDLDTLWHWYFIEDENDIFFNYGDWMSWGQITQSTFNGTIANASQAVDDGYYAVGGSLGWINYVAPSGKLTITELGEYDVVDKETVVLSVENLIPLNIREGVTILGVTGIAGTDKDGIFDNNGVQLASYETLVNDYGLDIEKNYNGDDLADDYYLNESTTINYILNNNPEFANATQLIVPEGVEGIGDYALASNEKLTGIKLPEGVARIGSNAFYRCSNLMCVNIPDSVVTISSSAFYYCSKLTGVAFSADSQIQEIGSYAFRSCESLEPLTIPDTVTSIGSYAFDGCDNLIQIEDGVSYVDKWVVDCETSATSVALRKDTVGIADDAIRQCSSIENIVIPSNVKSIGSDAFYSCSKLTQVTFEENIKLTSIGGGAFAWTNIKNITIPDSVTSIGREAFYVCDELTNIDLSNNLVSIGFRAFASCYKLENITLPVTLVDLGEDTFSDCNITSITVPEGVKVLRYGVFSNCDKLSEVNLHNNIVSIEESAFSNCTSLLSLTIPDKVTNIGESAFRNCTGLTSITIPESVSAIGEKAFEGCTNITSVHITDVDKWCSIEFGNQASNPVSVAGNLYVNDELITDLVIPEGTTSIGSHIFVGCKHLTSVIIPDSVTRIGVGAFRGCSSLESITLPFIGATMDDKGTNYLGHIFGATSTSSSVVPSSLRTVVITGGTFIGTNAFQDHGGVTNITIPDSVTHIADGGFSGCSSLTNVSFGEHSQLTKLGIFAFSSCTSLTSISLPEGVTNIGNMAFRNCTALTHISIPDSITIINEGAFEGCTNLTYTIYDNGQYLGNSTSPYVVLMSVVDSSITSFTIPDGTKIIYSHAFENCTALASIVVPSSVVHIGTDAFEGCSALDNVYITDLASWCKITFNNRASNPINSSPHYKKLYLNNELLTDLVIPEGITNIKSYAFCCCEKLKSVVIPEGVTSIGDGSFYQCNSLTSVMLPDSLVSIGQDAFDVSDFTTAVEVEDGVSYVDRWVVECNTSGTVTLRENTIGISKYAFETSVENVIIPEGVKYINSYAFNNRTSLTSITIPSSVIKIDSYAFYGCSNLTNVYITDLASWCDIEFGTNYANPLQYADNLYVNNELVTEVTIPDGVTDISNYAFYKCNSITGVIVPSSVTRIGNYAFAECKGITNVTLSEGLTTIGSRAFYYCEGITSITIPSTVTSIGSYAFSNNKLTEVHITDLASWCNIAFSDDRANPLCESAKLYLNGELITHAVIHEGVDRIGDYAFYKCYDLKSVTIPDSVTSIGNHAFKYCSELTSVKLSANLDRIDDGAFYYCSLLANVTLPDSLTSIGDEAFGSCYELTNVIIPNSVTHVGKSAFNYCSALTSINIPENITTINEYVLSGTDIRSIVVPDGVTVIGDNAFSSCYSLKSITIPATVTRIGNNALAPRMEEIIFLGTLEQWRAIRKHEPWQDGLATDTRIICTDDVIVV